MDKCPFSSSFFRVWAIFLNIGTIYWHFLRLVWSKPCFIYHKTPSRSSTINFSFVPWMSAVGRESPLSDSLRGDKSSEWKLVCRTGYRKRFISHNFASFFYTKSSVPAALLYAFSEWWIIYISAGKGFRLSTPEVSLFLCRRILLARLALSPFLLN